MTGLSASIRSRHALVAACAVAFVAATGCGTPCEQIARHRQAFLERTSEPTQAPHAVALLPLSTANEMIEPQVRAMEPMAIEVPGAGVLGPYLQGLTVQPRTARLVPATGPGVGLELVLDVVQDGRPLFSLDVGGVIQPRFEPEERRVVVELRASDFTTMTPRLAPDAVSRLTSALERIIPSVARLVLPGPVIAAGAAMVGEIVLSQSYPMIRDRLLRGLGPLARLRVTLPSLPLERIEATTRTGDGGGVLRLDLYTSLPVGQGVRGEVRPMAPGGDATLVLSGQTVAEVANWAMAEGRLPSRFDENGRASDDGQYRASLAWAHGGRPLRVHVWRLEERCLRALLAASPSLRIEGERIVLEIDEVRVEELEGPPWAGLARLFSGIWVRALERTQSTVATLEFEVGGRPVRGRITAVERSGDQVRLRMALDR